LKENHHLHKSSKKSTSKQEVEEHISEECVVSQCMICKNNNPFDVPQEIIEAAQTGKLIIFAGAGISTESNTVFPSSFYQNVREILKIPKNQKISFSKLMSLYCSHPRTRKDLLLEIKERIDYVKAFPELYDRATKFHREISTIPHIHEIFTTNWDDFFEKECDATPVVTGEDYAIFQDIPGRKVFKIHGSIYNYGSIIATEQDYKKCYQKLSTGIIGAKLKTHLLSKTMVFIGFSFEDEDFQKIYRLLLKDVHGIIPRSYVITLDNKAEEKLRSSKINAIPIITDGTFFIQELKKHLVIDKQVLPDEKFEGVFEMLTKVSVEHHKLSRLGIRKHPDFIYSLAYQDGLQHAFQHILSNKHSGNYSDPHKVLHTIESYEFLIKQFLRVGNYPDVAYFTGYQTGQLYFLLDNKKRKSLQMYFLFGREDIPSFKHFLKLEKNAAKYHKAAHKLAVKMASTAQSDDVVFHRSPFL